ncbi:MAG: DNA replication helicase protein MCM [Candidatus Fermentimicrarchaeum limneticum]|uniref:DNA helicase n=1 Tax=Fermentimicrarchaeum limneticum TaxID=2795018 RepID=A0A7D6BLL2_FERL1|nr:MAG: DNA replication helicase protein MCM [Candidatus Fermentimicrarchaeum limneticum]
MAEDISQIVDAFEEFFDTFCKEDVEKLLERYPERRSLEVSYIELSRYNSKLADNLINKPDLFLKAAVEALKGMAISSQYEVPFEPHVRFFELPEQSRPMVQDIGADHVGKLICVDGLITKRTEIRPKVKMMVLRCPYCEHIEKVPVDRKTVIPETCSSCKRKGLQHDEEGSKFVNLQKAEAQEPLERTRGGAQASHIEVWMEDDLVNTITPGQRVEVTAVLRIRPFSESKGQSSRTVYSKYLDAVHLKRVEKEFEEVDITKEDAASITALSKDVNIYQKIVGSIAPSIYGHDEVKEALALQLFGGTPNKRLSDGGKIRSDIHVLLIGDPGISKTRMLQYIANLAPKSIYVSGKAVTSAGLTATAEKDELGDGGWTLKAGALVLASGGLASIDEFDKIRPEELAAMHEVMESQSVSVAKAGIVAKFNAKTSILAAANPKYGRFDPTRYPAEQFDLPPTILSRFDLIFPIKDILDEEKDRKLASFILDQHTIAGKRVEKTITEEEEIRPPIESDMLRKYVAYARKKVIPVLTPEASDKIREYYVELRKIGAMQGAVPITPRYIEGMVRLAEASAKIRLSNRVELADADRAIRLMDFMLKSISMDKGLGRMDIDIITTGQPKSKSDRIRNVLDIIKELEKEYDLVEIERVVEEAKKYGLDEMEARRIIDEMLRKTGELYEPKHGHVKIVRPKVE